jgi:hypothetical protein
MTYNGAITLATANIPMIKPEKAGRRRTGTHWEMMTSEPENNPPPPNPAMARPTMKATEDGAVAQMRDPNSKINSAPKYTHFTVK